MTKIQFMMEQVVSVNMDTMMIQRKINAVVVIHHVANALDLLKINVVVVQMLVSN